MNSLKFFVLNAEDLFLYLDRAPEKPLSNLSESEWQALTSSTVASKPLKKLFELAHLIAQQSPDIIVMSEVGGLESLQNFNRLFLKDCFTPHLTEGNSDRGIDIGFLVKRSLPVKVHLQSNRDRPLNFLYPHEIASVATGYRVPSPSHKFSRDVPELHIFSSDDRLLSIFLGVHLKSRLDPHGIDPGGRDRREAEVKVLLEIFRERSSEFPHVPILVGGDFNGQAFAENGDTEFVSFFERGEFLDVLQHAGHKREDRFTHVYIDSNSNIITRALDFVFLAPKFKDHILIDETSVLDFIDQNGQIIASPKSLEERFAQPSDHRAIRVAIAIRRN